MRHLIRVVGLMIRPRIFVSGSTMGLLIVLQRHPKILRVADTVSLVNNWHIRIAIQLGQFAIELTDIVVGLAIESDDSVTRLKAETRCSTVRL